MDYLLRALRIDSETHDALEVSCGSAHTSKMIAEKYPELKVTASDWSAQMLVTATRVLQSLPEHSRPRVIVADACALPFLPESFDVVFSIGGIKHFPDKKRSVSEMVRVLRKGGRLFVTDLAPDPTHEESESLWAMSKFPHFMWKIVSPKLFAGSPTNQDLE